MRIRPATPADAPALARVQVAARRTAHRELLAPTVLAALSEADGAARWERSLILAPRRVLVADDGGVVVGFAQVGPSRDASPAPRDRTGELYALCVHPDRWGGGIGGRLWNAARQALVVEEYAAATVWVLEDDARARSFCRRAGFALDPAGRRTADLHGVPLPEVRYRRPIP